MKLKKIKIDKCPHCGSNTTMEERIKNGLDDNDVTENKKFECGLGLTCKCGSNEIIQTFRCPNSHDDKKVKAKRVIELNKLYVFIDNLDLDDEFKDTIRSTLLKGLS